MRKFYTTKVYNKFLTSKLFCVNFTQHPLFLRIKWLIGIMRGVVFAVLSKISNFVETGIGIFAT